MPWLTWLILPCLVAALAFVTPTPVQADHWQYQHGYWYYWDDEGWCWYHDGRSWYYYDAGWWRQRGSYADRYSYRPYYSDRYYYGPYYSDREYLSYRGDWQFHQNPQGVGVRGKIRISPKR